MVQGMAVKLLLLSDGNSSLEFTPDELERVRQIIFELFGASSSEDSPTYSRVTVAGETFLFEHGWDEPCLIATGREASRMLAQIADRINST